MIKKASILIIVTGTLLYSCVSVKPNELYIESFNPNDTVFYLASEIYTDYITSEGWYTESDRCLKAKTTKEAAYKGELGIDLYWDRVSEGCPWLGVGFGWDGWTGKDLSAIKNTAAIEFYVRMIEGERANIPWAVGLEDFTGAQAWLGVTSNAIKAERITTEWVRVEMPLSEFNWEEQEADVSNIKQIIFNLEADGHIYLDEIKIVPYDGGYRKRANLSTLISEQFVVDGKVGDDIWNTEALNFASSELHLAIIESKLCVALKVIDETPLTNRFNKKDVFKGDGLELAFSTDINASPRRTRFLSTDQHIGFGFNGSNLITWDWEEEREFKVEKYKLQKIADGYIFEAEINLSELKAETFELMNLYGLEIALNRSGEIGREVQERWNSTTNNGFYENPSLWGEMLIFPNSPTNN